MAKETIVVVTDDLTGEEGAETKTFSIDGIEYTIDLTPENAKKMEEALAEFMAAATRTSRKLIRVKAPATNGTKLGFAARRELNSKIRAWAEATGKKVASHGRIPVEIVEEYHRTGGAIPQQQAAEKPAKHRKRVSDDDIRQVMQQVGDNPTAIADHLGIAESTAKRRMADLVSVAFSDSGSKQAAKKRGKPSPRPAG